MAKRAREPARQTCEPRERGLTLRSIGAPTARPTRLLMVLRLVAPRLWCPPNSKFEFHRTTRVTLRPHRETAELEGTMNVLVLGATAATARLVVGSAWAAGYAVTAFVREASRLPLSHPGLRSVEGDAMDPISVAFAVRGADAVTCTPGHDARGEAGPGTTTAQRLGLLGRHQEHSGSLAHTGGRLIVESPACVGGRPPGSRGAVVYPASSGSGATPPAPV